MKINFLNSISISKRLVVLTILITAACFHPLVAMISSAAGQQQPQNQQSSRQSGQLQSGEFLPTGKRITPTAAKGSLFQPLNPDLPTRPDFVVGQAVTTAVSPDGTTLLILTSGYNRNNGSTGARNPAESNEQWFGHFLEGRFP